MSLISKLSSQDFVLQNIDVSRPSVGNDNKPIVLFIKADWCGYCQRYSPVFESLSMQFKKIKFCVLELTENESMLRRKWPELVFPYYKVEGYPTLVLYDADGNPLKVVEDRENIKNDLRSLA